MNTMNHSVNCYKYITLFTDSMTRGSLHFHAPITGVIKPPLLQTVLHPPIIAAAIAQVYDSIVTTELPIQLQLQCLLERKYPSLKAIF